ncbi:MAG: AMP-binding protein [Acidimicrobiales bacterium]
MEASVIPEWLESAAGGRGCLTVINGEAENTWMWADVHQESEYCAHWFSTQRVSAGSSLLIVAPTCFETIVAIRAAWMCGISVTVASISQSPRRKPLLQKRCETICSLINPTLILVDQGYVDPFLTPPTSIVVSMEDWKRQLVQTTLRRRCDYEGFDSDTTAVIQPTSGTTGPIKAVTVPHRCLGSNHAAIVKGLQATVNDTFVSWLPLSHDMGLIGMLGVPMMHGMDLVVCDPSLFSARPSYWMSLCSRHRATITCGPDSTYRIAGLFMERQSGLDLSALRIAINGSEMIDVAAFQRFLSVGERHGLNPNAGFAVYGLAEATLAVTFPIPGAGFSWDTVSREQLGLGRALPVNESNDQSTVSFAKLGSSVRGMQIRIVRDLVLQPDREVGQVQIRGEAVTPGYFHGDRPNDRSKSWLDTGDLGYMVNGDLIVCGRSRDLIIVGGRNIYPEEIERVAAGVPQVWRGHVAAFSNDGHGRERVIVAVESEARNRMEVKAEIRQRVLEALDVVVAEVRIMEPRSLPRTASGKIARHQCRDAPWV